MNGDQIVLAWVFRHVQGLEYLTCSLLPEFESLSYFGRYHDVHCVSMSNIDIEVPRVWSRPPSGVYAVHARTQWTEVLHVLRQLSPDVVVCEGAPGEQEWPSVRAACPNAHFGLYYGGGPLTTLAGSFPALDLFDFVIVPHEAQVRLLASEGVEATRAYGVPTNHFRPLSLPKQFHVVYPANFAPGKRHTLVAETLERYAPEKPSLFLGNFENPGCVHMAQSGGINLNKPLPHRNNILMGGRAPHALMPYLYNMSEVLVCGSQEEGHPNTVMEAMACGTPAVVLADCEWEIGAAFAELSAKFDGHGIVVVDADADSIHRAVEGILADYERHAKAARAAICAEYDWFPHMYLPLDRVLRNGLALKMAGQKVA